MIKMENDKKKKIKPGKNCIKIIIDVPKMKKKKKMIRLFLIFCYHF